MDTHGLRMNCGKYGPKNGQLGELVTRVPVSYLNWMINEGHQDAEIAKAELKRRGSVMPDIQISGHAIDRASLRCRAIWHQYRKPEEGLHAWLVRVAQDALEKGTPMGEEAFHHLGIKFVFAFGEAYPSLVTVMPKKQIPRDDNSMDNVIDGQEPAVDVDAHWANGSEE